MRSLINTLVAVLLLPALAQGQKKTVQLNLTYCQTITAALWSLTGRTDNCPTFILDDDNGVATYSLGDRRIRVDPATVRRMEEKLGDHADDALAAIIGHEIWHALHGQDMRRFGNWGKDCDSLRRDELAADQFGLMLAHFANYTEAPLVFDEIFRLIQVSGNGCYPPPDERTSVNNTLVKKARNEISLFEAANMALIVGTDGSLGFAIDGYRQVAADLMPFPDLQFNLGLAFFSRAMSTGDFGEYAFPLEAVDADALKIRANPRKAMAEHALLDSARVCFEGVLKLDRALEALGFGPFDARRQAPIFFQAKLGLMSVRVLTKDWGEVEGELRKFYENSTAGEQKDKVEMLQAIGRIRSRGPENRRNALGSFSRLTEPGRSPNVRRIAACNRDLANGTEPGKPAALPDCPEAGIVQKDVVNLKKAKRLGQGPVFFGEKEGYWFFKDQATDGPRLVFEKMKDCPCVTDGLLNGTADWQTGQGEYRLLRSVSGSLIVKLRGNGSKECFRVFE